MNSAYDLQLAAVPILQWLPWIGRSYGSDPNNTALIIGESHYIYEAEDENTADYFNGNSFTRSFISDNVIANPHKPMRLLRNLERCLYNEKNVSEDKIRSLWQRAAFMNFVQREMQSSDSRPSKDDFELGWRVFFQILQILKPKYCLFAGVTASTYENYYLETARSLGVVASQMKWSAGVGGSNFGRSSTLTSVDFTSHLVFIKHPSRFFSWAKWHSYLATQIPGFLSSLEKSPSKTKWNTEN